MRIAASGAWMDVLNSVQIPPSRGLCCPMAATSALLRLRTQASSNEQRKQVDRATARIARVPGSMAIVCIAPSRGEHPDEATTYPPHPSNPAVRRREPYDSSPFHASAWLGGIDEVDCRPHARHRLPRAYSRFR